MRASAVLAFVVSTSIALPQAHAQTDEKATSVADALFEEGRRALLAGDLNEACSKFEGSRKLDPSAMGTLFNLAICNERRGRYATAVLQFKEVLGASITTRSDRAQLSEAKIAELEPKLSRLRVNVPEEVRVPGLEVRIDDVVLAPLSYGTAIAVDGGEHVLEARAPGYRNASRKVFVALERANVIVNVTPLEPIPADEMKDDRPPISQSTWGLVALGGGVAALTVGTIFGIGALQTASDYNETRTGDRDAAESSLETKAWVANVTLPVGVILSALGVYLVATAPPSQSTPPASAAQLGRWAF